jgi:hypothetical protein
MGKEELDAAIAALEASGRTIDNWVLACAVGVAVFLAAEVVFSVAHWINERKLQPLRVEQSRLHAVELAELTNSTAKANNATEELRRQNLELEQALAPRSLEQGSLIEKLKPFAGTQVYLEVVPDFEARRFLSYLVLVFQAANWKLEPTLINDMISDGITIRVVSGQVLPPPPRTEDRIFNTNGKLIADIIFQHLRNQNIDVKSFAISPGNAVEAVWPSRYPKEAIRIAVGMKPNAYFLEQKYPQLKAARESSERVRAEAERRSREMAERATEEVRP